MLADCFAAAAAIPLRATLDYPLSYPLGHICIAAAAQSNGFPSRRSCIGIKTTQKTSVAFFLPKNDS